MSAPIKNREWFQKQIEIHLTKGQGKKYIPGNVHHKINHNEIMASMQDRLMDRYDEKKLTRNEKGRFKHFMREMEYKTHQKFAQ